MKKFKKIHTLGAIILAVGTTSITAFASSGYKTPAEAGKLYEFKKENIAIKKENLKAQVEAGRITQAKADEIIKAIEENQANCDGKGLGKIGCNKDVRFGSQGEGNGEGKGIGNGQGRGPGKGQGRMRTQD